MADHGIRGIEMCPPWAPALGFAGATLALVFTCIGSAYGTGKAAQGISAVGVSKPEVRAHQHTHTSLRASTRCCVWSGAARCFPCDPRPCASGIAPRRTPPAPPPSPGAFVSPNPAPCLLQIVMKNIIPVVMAGVLGIYGLIIAVIIGNAVKPFGSNGMMQYSTYTGFAHLAGGLCCGMSGLSAGIAIGIVGDAGVRAVAMQPKMYVGMVLILIFAEALGLYGLIVGLIMTSHESTSCGYGSPL